MTILVTGGAGFIGTNFILEWLGSGLEPVVNLDKLTYAGNRRNLEELPRERYELVQGDIGDPRLLAGLLEERRPRAVINFAAESHVDRSIHGPEDFIETNVVGTFRLLEALRAYLGKLSPKQREAFRLLHVSTDEVYGSLGESDPPFTELSPYAPNSPYSASKAASDHLVRAYVHTYGLPAITTNCSNNYGPWQFPEKLIPLMIVSALADKPLPVYGDGLQVRDWLYAGDHCRGLRLALERGAIGQSYNFGGGAERANIEVVGKVCDILDELVPARSPRRSLITYVKDRPGHDRRYAIDYSKAEKDLGFSPEMSFEAGLRATVEWYLGRGEWIREIQSGEYRQWMDRHYGG
ncbi:MAG: dTDP-glucose 4,6-dehydratase [Deltaproteobacteria bacterium]|jgi:dTDP-glucose 4,6-dehydratase|nr:dTDP-glucose 4,6-dehydratase [Deltaproteobacteria bacterium]